MGNNIVLVILAVILIVNMLLLMTSNKRKKRSMEDFKRQEAELAQTAMEVGKKAGLKFELSETYMNDKGRAIFATIDAKKRVLGMFYSDDVQLIPYDDIEDIEAVVDGDEKYVNSISVDIECKEKTLSYPFATERRKRKAWVTKFILKDSAEFVTKLKSLKK
ncbi:MAG TPA: hypothetical protein DCP98_03600 [Sphaerochaeta sp.]|nr:hypothetical protein [Sphaerochaeta sp.]